MNNRPVAVVDSGVGGLTCLEAIRKAMPREDIIYFGDEANMPYGTKSEEEILGFARDFGEFLKGHGVKMIIFACGTLSSTVIPFFYKNYPEVLVQGIVDSAAAALSRASEEGDRVGVIATPRSIDSGSYQDAIGRLRKKLTVSYMGCPELSVLIEKGVTDGPEMEALLRSYLDGMVNEEGIKRLLLGCTHYPLVSGCINKLYPDLQIVNPDAILAKNAYALLKVHGMDSGDEREGSLTVYTTKMTDAFSSMVKRLGIDEALVEEVSLR